MKIQGADTLMRITTLRMSWSASTWLRKTLSITGRSESQLCWARAWSSPCRAA